MQIFFKVYPHLPHHFSQHHVDAPSPVASAWDGEDWNQTETSSIYLCIQLPDKRIKQKWNITSPTRIGGFWHKFNTIPPSTAPLIAEDLNSLVQVWLLGPNKLWLHQVIENHKSIDLLQWLLHKFYKWLITMWYTWN